MHAQKAHSKVSAQGATVPRGALAVDGVPRPGTHDCCRHSQTEYAFCPRILLANLLRPLHIGQAQGAFPGFRGSPVDGDAGRSGKVEVPEKRGADAPALDQASGLPVELRGLHPRADHPRDVPHGVGKDQTRIASPRRF
mgnify:CR=1 FL=1